MGGRVAPSIAYWVKTGAALAFAAVTLWLAYMFFVLGVSLVANANVVSGLLSAAIGFALLSASVTLVRDWILVVRVEGEEKRRS